MYESHYGLHRRAFAATPDPSCCYLSSSHGPLLQEVIRCVDQGQGMAILTGPAGIGKSLLLQVLLAESQSRYTGIYLGTGQFPSRRALLQAVLYELGQPYGGLTDQELRLEIQTAVRSLISKNDGLLLILDEAHLLSDKLLEEIRLISDLSQYGTPLARVVLSGNPEFEERLTSPVLSAFNQRVACHVVLETLTRSESVSYLEHRVAWAGGQVEKAFDTAALELIAEASDGIPRCLNQLADRSLMHAYLSGADLVTETVVRESLAELQHLPLRWNPSALRERRPSRSASPATSGTATTITDNADNYDQVMSFADDGAESCSFEFGADDSSNVLTNAEPIAPVRQASPANMTPASLSPASLSPANIAPASIAPASMTPPAVPSTVGRSTSGRSAAGRSVAGEAAFESPVLEQDDERPLFPWLADSGRTIDAPAVQSRPHFDLGVGLPTRGRPRRTDTRQPLTVEIVDTGVLCGVDLRGRIRQTAAELRSRRLDAERSNSPAVEPVLDTYARLDARQVPVFPQPPVTFPIVDLPCVDEPVARAVLSLDERLETTTDAAERTVDDSPELSLPSDQVELAELTGVLHPSGGVELITEYGIEWIDAADLFSAGWSRDEHLSELDAVSAAGWMGSTVFEVGQKVQETVVKVSSPEQPPVPTQSVPERAEKAKTSAIELADVQAGAETDYDIVLPEADWTDSSTNAFHAGRATPHHDQGTAAEASRQVSAPPSQRYRNFFSVLRRRQMS